MQYPKINHLWLKKGHGQSDRVKALIREQNNGKLPFLKQYAEPYFDLVDIWDVEEKIDGTNIRIILKEERKGSSTLSERYKLTIAGRTKEAIVLPELKEYLHDTLTIEKIIDSLQGTNLMLEQTQTMRSELTLFGEGYGYKTQGDYYKMKKPCFALFDIVSAGKWGSREKVRLAAQRLQIPSAPSIGRMTEEEILAFVKSKPQSLINPQVAMEGIIARGEAWTVGDMPSFKSHKKFKLHCKDF